MKIISILLVFISAINIAKAQNEEFIENRNFLKSIPITECDDDFINISGNLSTGEKLEIDIRQKPFIPSEHSLGIVDTTYSEYNGNKIAYYQIKDDLIDGTEAYGIDGNLPRFEIDNFSIRIENRVISIPKNAYSDLYEPHFCSKYNTVQVYESSNGKYIYVYMSASDGAGSYDVKWIFSKGRYISRIISGVEYMNGFDAIDGVLSDEKEVIMNLGGNLMINNTEEEACFGCGDCSIYCVIENEFDIVSSSTLSSQNGNNYQAKNVDDYNLHSAWVEGFKGEGINEWVEFRFGDRFKNYDVKINGLYLYNGYKKSKKTWKENARIKKLKITVNEKDFIILKLHDAVNQQSIQFSPIGLGQINTIRFTILEVYPGDKYDDTALSELRLQGIHHH